MSIKLNFQPDLWIKNQNKTVEEDLKERQKKISEILNYDLCSTLIFNKSKNIAIVKSIYAKNSMRKKRVLPKTIFLSKDPKDILYQLIKTNNIVEHHEEEYSLVKGGKSEVFIPIFFPQKDTMLLIGCIYLVSYEKKKFQKNFLLEDQKLNNYISDIAKLLILCLNELQNVGNVMGMINIFLSILKHKDHFLPNHSYNVANWCKEIGMELGLATQELEKLYFAGLLHDLGKTMVDEDILNKPSKLSKEEYEVIKEHPIYSCTITKYLLDNIGEFKDIPEIVKHHHERYDGKGYPDGLKGGEVPFYSYIIGIADAVDAMLSNRSYKKPMPINIVISELYKNKGGQFHPDLVDIMAEKLTIAHKEFEKTLSNTIDLCSLIISFKEDILILEGSLIEIEDYFIFKPFDASLLENLDLSKAIDLEITIKDLIYLHHFEVKLENFVDNKFYISHLQLISSPNTFNLLWNLEGVIYYPTDKDQMPIEIIRVGGDSLSFAIDEDIVEDIPYGETIKVKIMFEDCNIEVSGNIVKGYNFQPYKYFDFNYTNIPDFKRDMIFRQLFKKQIELRKAISEYKY